MPAPTLQQSVTPPTNIEKQGIIIQTWIDQVPSDLYVILY